jgi:hypothetical protein
MFIECPQCKNTFDQDQPWKRVCLKCFLLNKNGTVKPQKSYSSSIPKQLLPKLIMLCHPDKHNGSKMSVEVTQQLLKLRDE